MLGGRLSCPGVRPHRFNCASGVMGSAGSAGGFAENNSARVIRTGKESPLDLERDTFV